MNKGFMRDKYSARNLWSGILLGIGFASFFDETLLHQILHWHHFYDKSTTDMGIVSDGFFHAFSWFATIGGLFMLADLRRRDALWITMWWAGLLLGTGVFQLFDGAIQHKLLRIHQIRYVNSLYVYDWIWFIVSTIITIAGIYLMIRARRDLAEAA